MYCRICHYICRCCKHCFDDVHTYGSGSICYNCQGENFEMVDKKFSEHCPFKEEEELQLSDNLLETLAKRSKSERG